MKTGRRWAAAVLYAAAIFAVSSIPKLPSRTPSIPGLDKGLHFVVYFGFAVLLFRALVVSRRGWRGALVAAVLIAALYGASDEVHQAFVDGRTATVGDWIADVAGAGAFGLVMWFRRRATPRD